MEVAITLSITTASDEGWVIIRFSDTGPSIKEPQNIFDPFMRPVGKGSGLGLSTCYGIIHDHGGEIDCENNPNGGATFKVKLPVEMPSQVIEPPPSETSEGEALLSSSPRLRFFGPAPNPQLQAATTE